MTVPIPDGSTVDLTIDIKTETSIEDINKIIEDAMICENGTFLECYDLCRTSKSFQTKV